MTYPLCGGCQCSSSGSLPSQQSSPLLWFQRTRDTQNLYCRDGHLLKLKCKYSNILRYWFLTFIKIKTKKLLKCFTLHAMNLKYMKVSLFEITCKKKWTFSRHSNSLRCTCILSFFSVHYFNKIKCLNIGTIYLMYIISTK